MKIGIISAMPEEAHLLQQDMQNISVDTIGNREYFSGKLYGIDTTLVFSRWGKVAAASTTATLIIKHKVTHIIFTGVAGAADTKLAIGDIVIADKLYQHDMDARPLCGQFEIPLTGKFFFEPDSRLLTQTQLAAAEFIKNSKFSNARIYTGTLASGDQFIADAQKTTALKTALPDLLAVDMESAAVAQVCSEYAIPYSIIRTISDNADHDAAINFQTFVTETASHYPRGILKILYPTLR